MLRWFFGAVSEITQTGELLALIGFGIFSLNVRGRALRQNPQTGEVITIKASKSVTFKKGEALK
ncbi:HU family DNA-binding protein [Alteromonas stellipolaris]|uniref:HU family DNA-binding protein n=1 Tax=Alteromonas stellipolaris TaxID=233316 RepID=UPI003BABE44A